MEYIPPLGGAADDPYVDANPASGLEGSAVPAAALEHHQREIIAVIEAAGLIPDEADLTQLSQAISALATGVAVGSLDYYPSETPPSGWLVRDGSAISRVVYADLFSVIGTIFGVGDGATTFNIPDDRGEFIRGFDGGRGIDAGRVFGSTQADEIKSHDHDLALTDFTGNNPGGSSSGWGADNISAGSTTRTVTATGGAESRPRNRAYQPIIKY